MPYVFQTWCRAVKIRAVAIRAVDPDSKIFAGEVKQIISVITYLFVFTTYSVTQIYLEFQKVKLKQDLLNATNRSGTLDEMVKKTGWTTLITLSTILVYMILKLTFAENSVTYFLVKECFIVIVVFIVLPLVMILRNNQISKYIKQIIEDSKPYQLCETLYSKCRKSNSTVKCADWESLHGKPLR